MLREDPYYAEKAARISALARDVSEVIAVLGLDISTADSAEAKCRVAYHSACSLQHGQRVHTGPKMLLAKAGFEVLDVPEGHLCCGSAGTYNLLQPEIAAALRDRKVANIASTHPDIVATGNIGCITQLASACDVPVVHTVELLDWATGGPPPRVVGAGWSCRRTIAGIKNDAAKIPQPITVGASHPARPSIKLSPAAPRSTKAIVIGSWPSSDPST